jgi:hypothetical protein
MAHYTPAEQEANEAYEAYERSYAEQVAMFKARINQGMYGSEHEEALYMDKKHETEKLWHAFCDMPKRWYPAKIALQAGKVHRVFASSPRFLDSPYCGSSRWNTGQARHVPGAEITCMKCLWGS